MHSTGSIQSDHVYLVGECNSSQDCHINIPFLGAFPFEPLRYTVSKLSIAGSGITIYVVQVNFAGINVSITVDTLAPTIRTFLEPKFYHHDFPLYDIQGLPWGSHFIDVALLDCQYNSSNRFAYPNGTSGLAFDRAVINDWQQISPSPAMTPIPSSSGGSRVANT